MEIRVRLPRVPAGLGSNLLGLVGLVAVVVAVGMLAGSPWAVLTGGLVAVGLAVIAQLGEAPKPQQDLPAVAQTVQQVALQAAQETALRVAQETARQTATTVAEQIAHTVTRRAVETAATA